MANAQHERTHRSGEGDVEEAALLFQGSLDSRAGMREQPFLDPHEKNMREFQSFAAMGRDKGHLIARVFLLG